MNLKKRTSKKAKTALALMLSLGCASSTVIPVLAAQTGSVTINSDQEVKYKGYNIFKADTKADANSDSGIATSIANVTWASQEVEYAVVGVINQYITQTGGTQFAKDATGHYNAQAVASFISAKIKGTNQTTIVSNDNLANKIAKAVNGLTKTVEVTPNQALENLENGYWLFTTDPTTTAGKHKAGTAPIFTLLGDAPVTIQEKTNIPTLNKQVKENKDGSWGAAADSRIGQQVEYKLTGKVAKNIKTYEKYSYHFEDTTSEGLDIDLQSVKVTIGKTDVTNKFTKELTGRTLKVGIEDLKTIAGVDENTEVVVEYKATLNKDAVTGQEGNTNTAKLIYSNDPHGDGKGETKSVDVKNYLFKLKLVKVDKDTNKPLQGAKFTIKAKDVNDATLNGKFLQADGTYADTEHKFETDEHGAINVKGIDRGTYTITETDAPDTYQVAKPVDFTVDATYDGKVLTMLTNVVSGDNVIAGLDTTDDRVMNADAGSAADAGTGEVRVTLGDIKETSMPLTGQGGIMAGMALGGGLFLVSAAMYVRNKKQENC